MDFSQFEVNQLKFMFAGLAVFSMRSGLPKGYWTEAQNTELRLLLEKASDALNWSPYLPAKEGTAEEAEKDAMDVFEITRDILRELGKRGQH